MTVGRSNWQESSAIEGAHRERVDTEVDSGDKKTATDGDDHRKHFLLSAGAMETKKMLTLAPQHFYSITI